MITVVGSINMDIAIETNEIPNQGETIFGNRFFYSPGGKGANQAIAASRIGGKVQMIGCIGDDFFGRELLSNLCKENVNTDKVQTVKDVPTGIANILLSDGDNRIIVISGANFQITPNRIETIKEQLVQSELVVLQLEIPKNTILKVLQICKEANVPVLLNPAPASGFLMEFMNYATYIIPNESECVEIFGTHYGEALEKYPNQLIVTLGKIGAQYFDGEKHVLVKGFETNVVDTTGAGDTFNGAFAFAISQKYSLRNAIEFANAAASLSVEKLGAQGGMPTYEQICARLETRKVK